eukprot:5795207-Pyramimonas_sp.AAC.1
MQTGPAAHGKNYRVAGRTRAIWGLNIFMGEKLTAELVAQGKIAAGKADAAYPTAAAGPTSTETLPTIA